MLRWSLKLSCYDYSIKYRPGKAIGNADALSRWTEPETASTEQDILPEVLLLEESPSGWNMDASRIATETKSDPILQRVMFYVLHGWPAKCTDPGLQAFWVRRNALSHNKDCLLWSNRVVVPSTMHDEVLRLLHVPHAGVVQTKAYARGYVWWPDMDQEIERIVAECEQCQAVRNNPPKDPQTWITADKPWSRVHIDFAGPFHGKTFLVLVDSYSKWFEAEMVSSMSSDIVIAVLRKIFTAQGLPDVLVSDNGRSFISEEFENFLQNNKIRHLLSPPYHPQTNGQIERAIQTFKNKMRKVMDRDFTWQEKLLKVLYYLRTVPNSSTNKTPAEMLNGRKYRTAVSSLHPDSMTSQAEVQRETACNNPPSRQFKVNQPVLIHMYGQREKWFRGVVEVVEGPSIYRVRTEDGGLHRRHADQILARAVRVDQEAAGSKSNDDLRGDADATTSEPPILIPDPELWPDIIGIPKD